jgi:K+-transporting ATPase ATPase C chain
MGSEMEGRDDRAQGVAWRIARRMVGLLLFFFLTGGLLFPFSLLAVGETLFPRQSEGSLLYVEHEGRNEIWGSALVAYEPRGQGWFHPRLSLSPDPVRPHPVTMPLPPLDERREGVRQREGVLPGRVSRPGDLVPEELYTFSASGLDPHLTLEGARYQVPRISRETGIPEEELERLIRERARVFPGARTPLVNVTELNLELWKGRNLSPSPGRTR